MINPLDSGAIRVTLNGVEFTTANGLKVTGEDKSRTVVLGRLRANQTYHAVLSVEDSEGETETRDLFFDTLDKDSFVIEVEDYNFNAGEYLDEPVVIPELDEDNMLNWDDNAYIATEGYLDIDYFDKNEILNLPHTGIVLRMGCPPHRRWIWIGNRSSVRAARIRVCTTTASPRLRKANG